MNEQAQFEEAVLAVVKQIYGSRSIPESHKQGYVDHITSNGFTDKMLDELEKFFAEDEKLIQQDLQDNEEIHKSLQAERDKEQEANDEGQAAIIATVKQDGERSVERLKKRIEKTEKEIEKGFESFQEKGEEKEEAAIRAKLGIQKEK